MYLYIMLKTSVIRCGKHVTSELQRPMLFREVNAVCSENRMKRCSKLYGSNVAYFNVKESDTCSDHHAFKCLSFELRNSRK